MNVQKEKSKGPSFEILLKKLEKLTEDLESGSMSLEDSLKSYEEGIKISRHLLDYLDSAEKRIMAISPKGIEQNIELKKPELAEKLEGT